MEASVLDLRKNMSKVISAIDRRERVTLTHCGRARQSLYLLPGKNRTK